MIDYILKETRAPDLFYVGHSLGSTAVLIALSGRPEYNSKVRVIAALTPAVYGENCRNFWLSKLSAPIFTCLVRFTGFTEQKCEELSSNLWLWILGQIPIHLPPRRVRKLGPRTYSNLLALCPKEGCNMCKAVSNLYRIHFENYSFRPSGKCGFAKKNCKLLFCEFPSFKLSFYTYFRNDFHNCMKCFRVEVRWKWCATWCSPCITINHRSMIMGGVETWRSTVNQILQLIPWTMCRHRWPCIVVIMIILLEKMWVIQLHKKLRHEIVILIFFQDVLRLSKELKNVVHYKRIVGKFYHMDFMVGPKFWWKR